VVGRSDDAGLEDRIDGNPERPLLANVLRERPRLPARDRLYPGVSDVIAGDRVVEDEQGPFTAEREVSSMMLQTQ
jgi:hypothetical protein